MLTFARTDEYRGSERSTCYLLTGTHGAPAGALSPKGVVPGPSVTDGASYARQLAADDGGERWLAGLAGAATSPEADVWVLSGGEAHLDTPRGVVAGILQARGLPAPGIDSDMRYFGQVYDSERARVHSIGEVFGHGVPQDRGPAAAPKVRARTAPEPTPAPPSTSATPSATPESEAVSRTAEAAVKAPRRSRDDYDPRSTIHSSPVAVEVPGHGTMSFPTVGHAYMAVMHPTAAPQIFAIACDGGSPEVLYGDRELVRRHPTPEGMDPAAVMGNILCLHVEQHPGEGERLLAAMDAEFPEKGWLSVPGLDEESYLSGPVARALALACGTPLDGCLAEVTVDGSPWTGRPDGPASQGRSPEEGFRAMADTCDGPSVCLAAPEGRGMVHSLCRALSPAAGTDLSQDRTWGSVFRAAYGMVDELVSSGARRIVVPFGPGAPQAVLAAATQCVRDGRARQEPLWDSVEVVAAARSLDSVEFLDSAESAFSTHAAAGFAKDQLMAADAVVWTAPAQASGRDATRMLRRAVTSLCDCAVIMAPPGSLFGESDLWRDSAGAKEGVAADTKAGIGTRRSLDDTARLARAMSHGGREVAVVPSTLNASGAPVVDPSRVRVVEPDGKGAETSAREAAQERWDREFRTTRSIEMERSEPRAASYGRIPAVSASKGADVGLG